MNLEAATVSNITWHEARTRYHQYRELVRSNRNATKSDTALWRAYRAIGQGKTLIDINLAIAGGGLDEFGLPRLAVARADWEYVHAWWHEGQVVFTRNPRHHTWKGDRRLVAQNVHVRFPEPPERQGSIGSRAQVPMIPARHRPTGRLSAYRILFEAEWRRVPPVDPVLLRHVDGPFFVVLAAWDLTPLEQSVLRARL